MAPASADSGDRQLGELPAIQLANLRGSNVVLLPQPLEESTHNLSLRFEGAAVRQMKDDPEQADRQGRGHASARLRGVETRASELRALGRELVRASYLKGDFMLRSGKRSNRYFDKFLFETDPALLRRLGKHLAGLVPRETQRLAAPELGAVLLGGAVSMETGLPLVLVRKEPKGYGTSKQIEGRFESGERVAVIEDVVTTGGDSLRSAQVLRDAGLEVIHLVVVLDRGEGGEENIRDAGIPYSPLFRIADLQLD